MERKSKLQMIAVDKLHPHPWNPRKVIGYVMSDEEKQLRDGTHPIFTTGEVN